MESGKTILITGAAGTMGRAAATALATEETTLVLVDLNAKALERVAGGLPGATLPVVLDIGDPVAVRRTIGGVQEQVGAIDVLLNNAGVLSKTKLIDTTAEEWRRVLRVNLDGAFFLSQAVVPGMREKGWGRIINVSSFAAKSGGITAGTAYSVSKGGLQSLTFAMAAELASTGITVNAIAPAYVETPMVTQELTDEERSAVVAKIPVGRYCKPEEFAHVVTFLASPLSGFITGEVVDLNGGLQFD